MRLLPLPPPAQGRLLSIQSEDPLPGHHPTSLSQIPQKLAQTGDQPGMREEKVIPGPGLHLCPRARALTPTIPKVEIAGTSFPTPIPPLKERKKKRVWFLLGPTLATYSGLLPSAPAKTFPRLAANSLYY